MSLNAQGDHSGGVESILKYIEAKWPVGKGSSPLHGGRINKIGLHKGLWNPEHVDRPSNQSQKNLRKETVLNKSQQFQVL